MQALPINFWAGRFPGPSICLFRIFSLRLFSVCKLSELTRYNRRLGMVTANCNTSLPSNLANHGPASLLSTWLKRAIPFESHMHNLAMTHCACSTIPVKSQNDCLGQITVQHYCILHHIIQDLPCASHQPRWQQGRSKLPFPAIRLQICLKSRCK